ncbi:MAG: hypothetical protein K8W52_14525 [Deltaproteobacteria bacterium]|nr:hypothetical protein [Deltaproteobacteria bacterium]
MGSSRVLALVAIATTIIACGSDAPPPTGPITAAITHYDVTFDLVTRHASATLTARVDTGGDCLALPFRATDLADVTIDGAPASGTLTADTLTVCGTGYEAGAELAIHAAMNVPLAVLAGSQVGYSETAAPGGNTLYYLISWIEGCDRFAPCDHRPSAFATYAFHVAHPAGVTVLCPGTITEDAASSTTTCAFDRAGGPTYSTFGLIASAGWQAQPLGAWDGIATTLYEYPGGTVGAKLDQPFVAGFVGWMQATFGPYPYGDALRVVAAPTYWSGFEHPGNIVLDNALGGNGSSSYLHPATHVLTHELAHQWAGDQTTLTGTYDFVWKEAMAEYLAFVYEAEHDPPAGDRTAQAWRNLAIGASYYPVPGEHPALFTYYGDAYGPGPMVLFRQLESLASRDQVIAALKTLLGREHAIGVDDVQAALEATTGLDLAAYFAAWVRGTGAPVWPTISASFTPGTGGAGTLAISQTNLTQAAGKGCACDVALRGAAGEDVRVPVDTLRDGPAQTLPVTGVAFAVTSTIVDPDARCLVYPATAAARAARGDHAIAPADRPRGAW